MTTRAKFKVDSVTRTQNGHSVELSPVTTGSDENKSFYKWTPGGKCSLSIVTPETATMFEPGREFYVDFTLTE